MTCATHRKSAPSAGLFSIEPIRPPLTCPLPLSPSSLLGVYFSELNDEQIEAMFFRVDWHRLWLHSLHRRTLAKGLHRAMRSRSAPGWYSPHTGSCRFFHNGS